MDRSKKKDDSSINPWLLFSLIFGGILVILFFILILPTNNYQEHSSNLSLEKQELKENAITLAKESIVWVKYEVEGKNADGSLFEGIGTGSGIIIRNQDNELTIYTNRHVVDCEYNDLDCFQRTSEIIEVRTQDGKIRKVDRVSFSESEIDLAILTIKTSEANNYDVAYYEDKFEIGKKVIAIGYPSYVKNVVEFSISEGKITNIKEVLSQSTGKGFRVLESDAYTYFGSSGGGLFNEMGSIIGITTWGSTGESVAIDFSSIAKEDFNYCEKGNYFADQSCYRYCDGEQVMGENRVCYDVCEGFYCNSQQPSASDSRCEDEGYILGSDDYCHLPCGSSNSYCSGSTDICFRNKCYAQCSSGYLWEDGTCREYA